MHIVRGRGQTKHRGCPAHRIDNDVLDLRDVVNALLLMTGLEIENLSIASGKGDTAAYISKK